MASTREGSESHGPGIDFDPVERQAPLIPIPANAGAVLQGVRKRGLVGSGSRPRRVGWRGPGWSRMGGLRRRGREHGHVPVELPGVEQSLDNFAYRALACPVPVSPELTLALVPILDELQRLRVWHRGCGRAQALMVSH